MEEKIIKKNTKEYSYTNRKGERIKVSKQHLDDAVEIKTQLQKASPSRRTSWSKHRKLMRKQGWDNSDTNENYRNLVKSYQKKQGLLPDAHKYAELVSINQLRAIQSELGALNSKKLEVQEENRKLRRMIRQVNKDVIFVNELKEAIKNATFITANNPVILPDLHGNENNIIACLSDIHYGAYVDIAENYYDTETVGKLLDIYADKLIQIANKEMVGRIDIVNLGDIVEHAYMRNQNLYDSEETLSEQIVHVTELIIKFIQKLREHVELITYRAIAGNHDRMQGDKNSNLNADHAVNISNQIIKLWIKYSQSDVKFVEAEDYFTDININGWQFAFVHGDRNNLLKKTTLAELSEQHDKHYDAIIGGHIHHQTLLEVGDNRYQASFGSIKGMDEYSLKLGAKASRSQGFVLISNSGFEIRKVQL